MFLVFYKINYISLAFSKCGLCYVEKYLIYKRNNIITGFSHLPNDIDSINCLLFFLKFFNLKFLKIKYLIKKSLLYYILILNNRREKKIVIIENKKIAILISIGLKICLNKKNQ